MTQTILTLDQLNQRINNLNVQQGLSLTQQQKMYEKFNRYLDTVEQNQLKKLEKQQQALIIKQKVKEEKKKEQDEAYEKVLNDPLMKDRITNKKVLKIIMQSKEYYKLPLDQLFDLYTDRLIKYRKTNQKKTKENVSPTDNISTDSNLVDSTENI